MPDNDTNSILNLTKMMSSLKTLSEPKGVNVANGNIIKEDQEQKPNLNFIEQSRLRETAKIIGQVLKVGAFEEGPEARRLSSNVAMQAKQAGNISIVKDKLPTKKEDSLMDMLGGLLGLLGLGNIKTLAKKAFDFIMKQLGTLFKGIGKSLYSSVKWVTSKLWGVMRWTGTKIWASVKWLGTKLVGWAGKIVDKIKGSKFFTGFMDKVISAKNGLRGIWDDVIKSIKGFIDDIVEGIFKVKNAAFKALEKVPGYNLIKKGAQATATGYNLIKKGVQATATGLSTAGGVIARSTGRVGEFAVENIGKLKELFKGEAGLFAGKLFKGGSGKIGSFFKSIPILSSIIEGLFTIKEINDLKEEYSKGSISLDDLRFKSGKRVIEAITGVGGAVLGGAALSFIPGIGTLVGGIGGDFAGRYLGDLLVKNIISSDITKKLGAYVSQTGEMQDFMVRGNNVYKFNSKDELMGMKTGGAIDSLFSRIATGMTEGNNINVNAAKAQINKLDELIYIMKAYLQKNTSGSSNTTINTPENIPTTFLDYKEKFNFQTLIPKQSYAQ